ncbi:MAG: NAAT family transporter [Candidatus Dadabacteria bacterium]|nr:NAAT family transporter [Candidatus Dadabacteria bacterium]
MLNNIIWTDVIAVSATLFFVMDPLGNIPTFQSILQNFNTKSRIKIIFRELIFALVILLVFLVSGTKLLSYLGLSQPSLSIAGGILLFIIALRMVFPTQDSFVKDKIEEPFIVPLAVPLIAGPSTIAILLLLSSSEPQRMTEWILSLLIAWLFSTIILVVSPFILKFLGKRGLKAIERLMGMILVLIAVQMFLNGYSQYIKETFK